MKHRAAGILQRGSLTTLAEVLSFLIAVFLVIERTAAAENQFEGRTISDWIRNAGTYRSQSELDGFKRMLSKRGDIAVPLMIKAIGDFDSREVMAARRNISDPQHAESAIKLVAASDDRARVCAENYMELGTAAHRGVPALEKIVIEGSFAPEHAIPVLAKLGEAGVASLAKGLTNSRNLRVRTSIAQGLALAGANARAAIPTLLAIAKDGDAVLKATWPQENTRLRLSCIVTLGHIGESPMEVVPILKILLEDSDKDVSRSALGALASFARDDVSLKEAFLSMTKTGNDSLKEAATNWIKVLSDPDHPFNKPLRKK